MAPSCAAKASGLFLMRWRSTSFPAAARSLLMLLTLRGVGSSDESPDSCAGAAEGARLGLALGARVVFALAARDLKGVAPPTSLSSSLPPSAARSSTQVCSDLTAVAKRAKSSGLAATNRCRSAGRRFTVDTTVPVFPPAEVGAGATKSIFNVSRRAMCRLIPADRRRVAWQLALGRLETPKALGNVYAR